MLSRYRIVRGRRDPADPLPEGVRLDTRKHTRSPFRPDADDVAQFLAEPDEAAFARFRKAYLSLLEARHKAMPEAFAQVAELARNQDVYLGCNCPTQRNPDVRRCHTMLALQFMAAHFPWLDVRMPPLGPSAVE